MFSIILLSSTLSILIAPTPITLGIIVLTISLTLAILFNLIIRTWFAFLIFLIYIGGMLVIFSYFLALTPNQQIRSGNQTTYFLLTASIITLLLTLNKQQPTYHLLTGQGFSFLYMKSNTPVLILLARILLLTIIIVVNLTSRSKGPLRPFNYV